MTEKEKPKQNEDRALSQPPRDRMIRKPATTREVLGRDFHSMAETEGKPKHDHD